MRDAVGLMPRVLARRWAAVDRLGVLVLGRDAAALPPGPRRIVRVAERSQTRPAAWVLDRYARADGPLGPGYATWASSPPIDDVMIDQGRVVPAGLGATLERFSTHVTALPRDQWAEITIDALSASAGYAAVGVVLRASPPEGSGRGYLIVAAVMDGDRVTRIGRFRSLVLTWLATFPTPWRPGEVLRAEADYHRVRVYREGVLIAAVADPEPLLVGGRAGVAARMELATDAAALRDFCAGPLREEYAGQLLEAGDVMASLGLLEPTAEPASVEIVLVNHAPIAGAPRFAALIRHGRNLTETVDLRGGGTYRDLVALRDASAPLVTARRLVVTAVGPMTEDRVRLTCRGIDATLSPLIAAGPVPAPVSSPPLAGPPALPDDPCAAPPPPDEIVGGVPDEPADDGEIMGIGPEGYDARAAGNEPEEPEAPAEPLAGFYRIQFGYFTTDQEHAYPTEVLAIYDLDTPDVIPPPWTFGVLSSERLHGAVLLEAEDAAQIRYWWYRGPAIGGTHIVPRRPVDVVYFRIALTGYFADLPDPLPPTVVREVGNTTLTLAHYDATWVQTLADLESLRLSRVEDLLPTRIETLTTLVYPGGTFEFSLTAGGYGYSFPPIALAADALPLNRFFGPQLIGVEVENPSRLMHPLLTIRASLEAPAVEAGLKIGAP